MTATSSATSSNPFRVPAAQQRKAILAGLGTLLTALGTAAAGGLDLGEVLLALGGAVTAYGVTFGVGNGSSPDLSTSTPQE